MDIVSSLNRIKQQLLALSWETNSDAKHSQCIMTDEEFSGLERELSLILSHISQTSGEEREILNQEVQNFYNAIKERFESIREKLDYLKNEHEERVQYIKAVNAYGKS